MFDASDPAPDVKTLLAHLAGEQQDGDLYRGQRKDFPALIPSAYRRGMDPATAGEPVVRVDETKLRHLHGNTAQSRDRYGLVSKLIAQMGVALGNLVAQQYAVLSECLDVSEDPRVAAFFATRAAPHYGHSADGDVGVIYRFRRTPGDLIPPEFSLDSLANWFEMGRAEGAYYDWFVHRHALSTVFDRDRWTDYEPGREALVETLPLRMRWTEVVAAVDRVSTSAPARDDYHPRWFAEHAYHINWRVTRVAKQAGGFLRPAYIWRAKLPSDRRLWPGPDTPRPSPSGVTAITIGRIDDGLPWPRAVPSLAVKDTLVGVENLRHRAGCECFYFRHGSLRITGLYRRELWPEPSEDPLYGAIWQQALSVLMSARPTAEALPPIDDPESGLLDRGYRVVGEKQTRSARELDDLNRGQLEDALESIEFGSPTADDWHRAAISYWYAGDTDAAQRYVDRGLARAPWSRALTVSAAGLAQQRGDTARTRELLARAELIAPSHPDVLLGLSQLDFDKGDYREAAVRLDAALATLDPVEHKTPEYMFIEARIRVAFAMKDEPAIATLSERYRALGFNPRDLIAQFRRDQP